MIDNVKESHQQGHVLLDLLLESIDEKNEVSLCRLSDIQTARVWDYSLPTLTYNHRFTDRNTYASDDSFMETLQTINNGFIYEILTQVGAMDESNHIVLYGGALLDIILKREKLINDFDLRLIGTNFIHNPDACIEEARKFVAKIFEIMRANNIEAKTEETQEERQAKTFDIDRVIVARSQSTVTIEIPMPKHFATNGKKLVKFQFTFSPYANEFDLLKKCHPHCTELAIINRQVKLTKIAKYCIESVCIVLDTRSLTNFAVPKEGSEEHDVDESDVTTGRNLSVAMKRVVSYFEDKGFDIILPDLDMTKVPTRNLKFGVDEVLDLPSLTVIFDEIIDKKIIVSSSVHSSLSLPTGNDSTEIFSTPYDSRSSFNVGESIHHNIRCLVSNVYDKFHFVAQGEVYDHIFDYVPLLTSRMISKTYETVKVKIKPPNIDINAVMSYFSATTPDRVVEMLIVEPLKKKSSMNVRSLEYENVLKEIIDKEVASLEVKRREMKSHMQSIGGLDNLVSFQQENVSTPEQILKALYGHYCSSIDNM